MHALFWIAGERDYNSDAGRQFIDENISCALNVPYKDIVLRYQNHRHRKTCFKKHNTCRFGFPKKPCLRTRLLDDEEIQRNHGRFLEIRRTKEESTINFYHPKLLQLFRANMDIQLVVSARAVAYYVGKYISKAEPQLIREETRNALNAIKGDSRTSYHQQAKKIASTILSRREISSQECAFRTCHLPLRRCSRKLVFISSCKPEDRLRMVDKDSFLYRGAQPGLNIIDRYMLRPKQLENLCLYEFAAWWQPRPKKLKENRNKAYEDEDLIENEDYDEEEEDGFTAQLSLKQNKGVICRRKFHAVISHPRYNPLTQSEDYMYSMILLYFPFEREEMLLERFDSIKAAFIAYKDKFRTHADDSIINTGLVENIENLMFQLQTPVEFQHCSRPEDDLNDEQNFAFDNEDEPLNENDLFPQVDEHPTMGIKEKLARWKLNQKQRALAGEIYEHVRNRRGQQYLRFVQGQAGVGKSFLINVITEIVTALEPGRHRSIIKTAITGVAAKNIAGVTIHKAYNLPIQKGFEKVIYMRLGAKLLSEKRQLLEHVTWIIIDEISMVGYATLRMISMRLCEIFQNDLPFGGRNVILFGDLMQLAPIKSGWVFQQPEYFRHEENLWDLFQFTELTEIMRQKKGDEFTEILQRLRFGTCLKSDVETLRSRLLSPGNPNYYEMLERSKRSLHMYPKVKMVEEYNEKRLNEMQEAGVRLYKFRARDTHAIGRLYGQPVSPDLIKTDIRQCAGIPTTLIVAIGCTVMLKWNISPTAGLLLINTYTKHINTNLIPICDNYTSINPSRTL